MNLRLLVIFGGLAGSALILLLRGRATNALIWLSTDYPELVRQSGETGSYIVRGLAVVLEVLSAFAAGFYSAAAVAPGARHLPVWIATGTVWGFAIFVVAMSINRMEIVGGRWFQSGPVFLFRVAVSLIVAVLVGASAMLGIASPEVHHQLGIDGQKVAAQAKAAFVASSPIPAQISGINDHIKAIQQEQVPVLQADQTARNAWNQECDRGYCGPIASGLWPAVVTADAQLAAARNDLNVVAPALRQQAQTLQTTLDNQAQAVYDRYAHPTGLFAQTKALSEVLRSNPDVQRKQEEITALIVLLDLTLIAFRLATPETGAESVIRQARAQVVPSLISVWATRIGESAVSRKPLIPARLIAVGAATLALMAAGFAYIQHPAPSAPAATTAAYSNPSPSGIQQPERVMGTVLTSAVVTPAAGGTAATGGVSITVPSGTVSETGKVLIARTAPGVYDFAINVPWDGTLELTLPLADATDVVVHDIAGVWVPESMAPGQSTVATTHLSLATDLKTLVKSVQDGLSGAVEDVAPGGSVLMECLKGDLPLFLRCAADKGITKLTGVVAAWALGKASSVCPAKAASWGITATLATEQVEVGALAAMLSQTTGYCAQVGGPGGGPITPPQLGPPKPANSPQSVNGPPAAAGSSGPNLSGGLSILTVPRTTTPAVPQSAAPSTTTPPNTTPRTTTPRTTTPPTTTPPTTTPPTTTPPTTTPPSIVIGWSSKYPSWITLAINGFTPAKYQYYCVEGGRSYGPWTVNQYQMNTYWDNGQTCYDTVHGDTVQVRINGVTSNVITVP